MASRIAGNSTVCLTACSDPLGIDLVRPLKHETLLEWGDYFLCVLMFKCTHGLAPLYLSNDVTMHVNIHGYNTRSVENMDLCIPRFSKEIYIRSFLYKGGSLWNKLPPWSSWVELSWILPDLRSFYKVAYIYPSYHFIVLGCSQSDLLRSETFLSFIMTLLLLCTIYLYGYVHVFICIHIFTL